LIDTARTCFHALADDGDDIALAVGGFSASGEIELWYGGTVMKQPFARLPFAGSYYGGQPPISPAQFIKGYGKRMLSPTQIIAVDDFVLTAMELQREHRWGPAQGYPHDVCLVGGEIELACVTATECNIRTLKIWPDEVDELILPDVIDWPEWRRTHATQGDSAPAANAPAPHLSRHARRAAKSKSRRAA
jgi:hypothetical protein